MLAVRMVAQHDIIELLPQLRRLREDVRENGVVEAQYLADIDRTIEALSAS